MKVLAKYIKVYLEFWKVATAMSAMYRVDTLMLFLGVILAISLNTLFFGLIFDAVPSLGSWSFHEVVLLVGIFQVNWGILKIFYGRAMEDVIEKIFDGTFDFYLLKPVNERFLAYLLPPLFKGIPSALSGVVFIISSLQNVDVNITFGSVFLLVFYLLVAQVIAFSFFQFAVSLSFFSGRSDEVFAVFENAWFFARYPAEVFSGKVLFALTYIIPITIFASYPTSLFLGKMEMTLFNLLYPVLVGIAALIFSNIFYKLGVKHYTGAGG